VTLTPWSAHRLRNLSRSQSKSDRRSCVERIVRKLTALKGLRAREQLALYESHRDLRGDEHIILKQRNVGAQGRAFACFGHSREQKWSQVATDDLFALSFNQRLVEYILQQ